MSSRERARQPARLTAEEAVARIAPEAHIVSQSGAAEPTELLDALGAQAPRLGGCTLSTGVLLGGYEAVLSDDSELTLRTWFHPGTLIGNAPSHGRLQYLPLTWRQVADYVQRASPDVALLQVGPADRDGMHSLGVSTSHSRAMAASAEYVVAEVNLRMPRTMGDSLIHGSEIDALVAVDRELHVFPGREPSARDREIAARVVALVPDGATLQLGIGGVPTAIAGELIRAGRRGLRLVSHLSDAARVLLESAAVAPEPAIVGEIGGSGPLYDWAHDNPQIRMADVSTTHRYASDVHRPPFVAVNSAIAVDLAGQVNTEHIDGAVAGIVGGILDFAQIVQHDRRNLSVIALPSVTRDGASRLVTALDAPAAVPRALAQIVVTEFGVADLRDASVSERARRLIAVAHPDHREWFSSVAAGV
jgi:4-hydroxybutyrate CoA-transferase